MHDWVEIIATVGIALAGFYFANSLHRKRRAEVDAAVAEKRFSAYSSLWALTEVGSPTRRTPLTEEERVALAARLTGWYYRGGQGMLMTEQTRNIFMETKDNLTREDGVTPSLPERAGPTGEPWSDRSIRQLSLLRTSMRADLLLYAEPRGEALTHWDVAFLEVCKVKLYREPWRSAIHVDAVAALLARSRRQFVNVVGNEETMRRSSLDTLLRWDSRYFVPAYTLVLAASIGLLAARDFAAALWIALLASVGALATALLDLRENRTGRSVLEATKKSAEQVGSARGGDSALAEEKLSRSLETMRRSSLGKWAFAFLTTGLLSASFLERGSWWSAIGAMYLAAGAAGMLAVLLNLGPHTRSSPLHAAFLGMGLAVLVGLGFSIALAAEPAPHDGGAKTSLASYPPS